MFESLGDDLRATLESLKSELLLESDVLNPAESDVHAHLTAVFPHYDGTSLAAVVALQSRYFGASIEGLIEASTNFILDADESLLAEFLLPMAADFDFDDFGEAPRDICENTTGSDSRSHPAVSPAPSDSDIGFRPSPVNQTSSTDQNQSCAASQAPVASDTVATATQSVSSSSMSNLSHSPFLSRSSSLLASNSDHKSNFVDRLSASKDAASDTMLACSSNSSDSVFERSSSLLLSSNSNHQSPAIDRSTESKDILSDDLLASSSGSSNLGSTRSSLLLSSDSDHQTHSIKRHSESEIANDTLLASILHFASLPERSSSLLVSSASDHKSQVSVQHPGSHRKELVSDSLLACTSSSSTSSLTSSPARSLILMFSGSDFKSEKCRHSPYAEKSQSPSYISGHLSSPSVISSSSSACQSIKNIHQSPPQSEFSPKKLSESPHRLVSDQHQIDRSDPVTAVPNCTKESVVLPSHSESLVFGSDTNNVSCTVRSTLVFHSGSESLIRRSRMPAEDSSLKKDNPSFEIDESSGDTLPDIDSLLEKTDSKIQAEKAQGDMEVVCIGQIQRPNSSNSLSSDMSDLPDLDFMTNKYCDEQKNYEINQDVNFMSSPVNLELSIKTEGNATASPTCFPTAGCAPVGKKQQAKAVQGNTMLKKCPEGKVPEKGSQCSGKGKALLKRGSKIKSTSSASGYSDCPVDDAGLPSIMAPKRKLDTGLLPVKFTLSPSKLSSLSALPETSVSYPVLSHPELKNSPRPLPSSGKVTTSGTLTYLGKSNSSGPQTMKLVTSAESPTVGGLSAIPKSAGAGQLLSGSGISTVTSALPSVASLTSSSAKISVTSLGIPAHGIGLDIDRSGWRSQSAPQGDHNRHGNPVYSSATLTSVAVQPSSHVQSSNVIRPVVPMRSHTLREVLVDRFRCDLEGVGGSDFTATYLQPPTLRHPVWTTRPDTHFVPPLLKSSTAPGSPSAPLLHPCRGFSTSAFSSSVPASHTATAIAVSDLNSSSLANKVRPGSSFPSNSSMSVIMTAASALPYHTEPAPSLQSSWRTKAGPQAVSSSQLTMMTQAAATSVNTLQSKAPTSAAITASANTAVAGRTGEENNPLIRKAVFEPPSRLSKQPVLPGVRMGGKAPVPLCSNKQGVASVTHRVVDNVIPMEVDDAIVLDDTIDSQGEVEIVASTPSASILIEDNHSFDNPGPSTSAGRTHLPQVTIEAAASAGSEATTRPTAGSAGGQATASGLSGATAASSLASRHPGIDIGVRSVLEVFPDASPQYIRDMLEGFLFANGLDYALSRTMDCLLDNPSFPRRKPGEPDIIEVPPDSEPVVQPVTVVHVTKPTTDSKDYFKEWDRPVSGPFYTEALNRLSMDFPWLNRNNICAVMNQYRNHYAPAYRCLEEAMTEWKAECLKQRMELETEKKTASELKKTVKRPDIVTVICHKGEPTARTFKFSVMKRTRDKLPAGKKLPDVYDSALQAEMDFVARQFQESDRQMALSLLETDYEEQGQLIECNCCFAEHPFESLVQCFDGHLFCCQCLVGYAKEAIYGSGKLNLPCMADCCDTGFPKSQLFKALPPDMMEKYDERVAEESLILADMPDLVRCPKCSIAAVLDPAVRVFRCPNADCRKETCRDCKEEWAEHIGKTCDQVEKKDETTLRTQYEEKMTQAKVRTCPKCKAQFFKEEGCNKMTCRCGTTMCYICRRHNISYKHFCQHPRDPGKGCDQCVACSLWTNPEEDEKRAIQEMQKEAQEKRREQGYTDERVIGVPEGPPAKKKKK